MPMELISYDIFFLGRGGGGKALVTRDLLFTCHAHGYHPHGIHRDIYTTKLLSLITLPKRRLSDDGLEDR